MTNGGKNMSGVVDAFRLGRFAAHYIAKRHKRQALLSIGVVREPRPTKNRTVRPGPLPDKEASAPCASPYRFFSIFRKNGAVLLTVLFATSSGEPVATTSPPNSPASGPISIR